MSQFLIDEDHFGLYHNQLDVDDSDEGQASCLLDGSEWIALGDSYSMAPCLNTGIQDYPGPTESQIFGPQHDSVDGYLAYSTWEAGIVSDIADSWEIERDAPINNQDNATNTIQNAQFSDTNRQYAINHGPIDFVSSTPISALEDLTNFYRAHAAPVTIGIASPQQNSSIVAAIPQHSFEPPHGILLNTNYDQFSGLSRFPAFGNMNSQTFEIPPAVSTYAYGFSEAQPLGIDSSRNLPDFNPYLESSSSDFIHISEPWVNTSGVDWVDPIGTYSYATLTEQNQWAQIPHPQHLTLLSPSTDSQISGINVDENEDFQFPSWVEVSLTRTNSLANAPVMHHGNPVSAEYNAANINWQLPTSNLNLNHLNQGDQFNKRPGHTQRRVSTKGCRRLQTQEQKEAAYKIRIKRGVCEHSRLNKKVASLSVPCESCRKIIGKDKDFLSRAICYKRNFEQVFGMYSDFFGILDREKSIKYALGLMVGPVRDLKLGYGAWENSSEISINIDTSSTLSVKIRRVTLVSWHTISTHDLNLFIGVVDQETSQQASYAIVPDSLPHTDKLDAWGRQDIPDVARKWPDDLAAAYDLAFLEYLEHYKMFRPQNPELNCLEIVEDTMRIVSLGKNLDSRRPIDHEKIMEMVTHLLSPQVGIEEPQFGVEEFNEYKSHFQLSGAARIQLYSHAAREIEKTQLSFGQKLDKLFEMNGKGMTREQIILIGACMHRLCLEYRQRLQRYREFVAGSVDDRIERCSFIYSFFTRLYEFWFRGRAKRPGEVFPMSSAWSAEDFSESLHGNANLMQSLWKLNSLERDFCLARQNDSSTDDEMYKKLVGERLRRAHSLPIHSTSPPHFESVRRVTW